MYIKRPQNETSKTVNNNDNIITIIIILCIFFPKNQTTKNKYIYKKTRFLPGGLYREIISLYGGHRKFITYIIYNERYHLAFCGLSLFTSIYMYLYLYYICIIVVTLHYSQSRHRSSRAFHASIHHTLK